jgi:hypothetical protein
MKLYNDQRNAQVFSWFIYLLLEPSGPVQVCNGIALPRTAGTYRKHCAFEDYKKKKLYTKVICNFFILHI